VLTFVAAAGGEEFDVKDMLILGPMMEENLRRALLLSRGDRTLFFTRGLSASLLAIAAALLLIVLLPAVRKKREEAFVEE
jgi:TctA family transporter